METINKFLTTYPKLKTFLFGLTFACAAVVILFTMLFSLHGPEGILEDLYSAFLFGLGVYLLVSFVALTICVWSELDE